MRRAMMVGVAALAAVAIAPAAHAQTPLDGDAYAFPVPDYVGALVGANSLDPGTGKRNGRADKPKERDKRVKRPTRRQLAALRFQPTPEVTQGVYQRVIDEVGPIIDPMVLTGQLDAAKAGFREVLAGVGWKATDLGDVAAFSLVQGYVTWRRVRNASEAGLKVLRREVRGNLALQRQVRRLSETRKQEIAEMLELRVIFFLDAFDDARLLGDSTGVAIARADMREWTETIFGVDVNEVRLTRRGLVER